MDATAGGGHTRTRCTADIERCSGRGHRLTGQRCWASTRLRARRPAVCAARVTAVGGLICRGRACRLIPHPATAGHRVEALEDSGGPATVAKRP